MREFDDTDYRETATELEDLIDSFEEANEAKPQLHQLLGILLRALNYSSDDYFSDVEAYNVIDLKPKSGLPASSIEDHLLLSDGVFNEAYYVLGAVSKRMAKGLGSSPKLDEFLIFLHTALSRFFPDIIKNTETISGVSAKKGKGPKPKPGDVFSIPITHGGQYFGVVITKNLNGWAFGFFQGTDWKGPLTRKRHPPVFKYPVYSSEELLKKKKWKIIDHCNDLLDLFPSEPEIFFDKKSYQDDPEIGIYGSAESPDESLRHLSKGEAEEIGLLDDSYEQMVLPRHLVAYLEKISKR